MRDGERGLNISWPVGPAPYGAGRTLYRSGTGGQAPHLIGTLEAQILPSKKDRGFEDLFPLLEKPACPVRCRA